MTTHVSTRTRVGVAAAMAAALLSSCGSSSSSSASSSSKPKTAAPVTPAGSALPSSITIVGDAGKHWTPSTPVVKAGVVDVAVTSTGKTHNLVIAGVAGGKTGPIFPGETVHLRVTLKPGRYAFRCTYHHMMTGTLTAE